MRMRNPKFKDEILTSCDFYYNKEEQFAKSQKINIEIGMGKGNFILGMAQNYPDTNFIGVEKYSSVASIAIKKMMPFELPNLKVLVTDAINLPDYLNHEVDTIYLNFSDPWPKKRHARRRLTSEDFLRVYDMLFKGDAHIIMKTDNDDLFAYSLDSLQKYGYQLLKVSYDLHNESIFNVETEYENKFSQKGIKIKYLEAIKKK
jgi:tRNA (guanine-N7-)-methyltransferase